MYSLGELMIKAQKNNNTINISEILDLNLKSAECEVLIDELKSKNININYDFIEEMDNELDDIFCVDPVKQYIRSISKIKLLSPEESNELFNEYRISGSEEIRQKLIVSNLKLVVNIAKEYTWRLKNNSHEFLDIIQEGNKGLMIAVERFDPNLGNKFSSYAKWWILSAIESSLITTGKFIKIPPYILNDYQKIQKYKAKMNSDKNIELTDLEIAQILGISEKKAKNVLSVCNRTIVSMDEPIFEDNKLTRINYISVDNAYIEDIIIEKMNYELIKDIMISGLTEREFFAISYRFGIINEVNNIPGQKTFEEVGLALGITRQAVNQIFKKAYEKIKLEYEIRMSGNVSDKKKIKN